MTDVRNLRFDVEMRMAHMCYQDELDAKAKGLNYKCVCKDPSDWTEEQCLDFLEQFKGDDDEI